jgi:hypothetical protein
VRSMRNTDSTVGRLTLDELQQHGVVGPDGGVGYSEGYGDDPREMEEDVKATLVSPRYERSSTRPLGTPLLPRAKKVKRNPTTPSRAKTTPQVPQTTPGGNFSDLLLAAELATRPTTPTREGSHPISAMSATRSTTARLPSAYDSPTKKPRREPPATVAWETRRREGFSRYSSTDDGAEASALDLLAQASQDVAQNSRGSMASAARLGGVVDSHEHSSRSRSETPLGPAIKLQGSSSTQTPGRIHTPGRTLTSGVTDDPFNDSTAPGFQSPSGPGAVVPGLGKYVHLTSTMPPRRTRSPYLKWTREEVCFTIYMDMHKLTKRTSFSHVLSWSTAKSGILFPSVCRRAVITRLGRGGCARRARSTRSPRIKLPVLPLRIHPHLAGSFFRPTRAAPRRRAGSVVNDGCNAILYIHCTDVHDETVGVKRSLREDVRRAVPWRRHTASQDC